MRPILVSLVTFASLGASVLLPCSTAFAQTAPPALLPPPVAPPAASHDTHLDIATLKVLRDRDQITQAEYESALRDMNDGAGSSVVADAPTFVLGSFSTTVYGRAKADFIFDNTESFGDLAGNSLVAPPAYSPRPLPPSPQTNYAGYNPRMQFSMRDSRLGFHVRAPEKWGVRASGLLEMDFFGQVASNASEAQSYSSAMAPRLRHFYFRIDTPVLDILVGQYWHLFGWQNVYHPASVQAQGLLGQIYSRDVQLRLSKTVASSFLNVEIAAAVLRPPQRDSGIPQAEAGARLTFNKWTGLVTNGASGTSIQPLSVGVTGNFRQVSVPEMSFTPHDSVTLFMPSIAVDGYLPIVPATADRKDNALSVHGELVSGKGIADLYTSLTGGIGFPTLPPPANGSGLQGEAYPQNIDNGIVTFDGAGNLHAIEWTTYLVGAQYYLPFTHGRVFIVGNYSHIESGNIASFTQATAPTTSNFSFAWNRAVIQSGDLYDADLFADVMSGVRIGFEGALYKQHYVDGIDAQNIRLQAAGMFNF